MQKKEATTTTTTKKIICEDMISEGVQFENRNKEEREENYNTIEISDGNQLTLKFIFFFYYF